MKEASTPENKNEKSSMLPVFKFSRLKFVICVLKNNLCNDFIFLVSNPDILKYFKLLQFSKALIIEIISAFFSEIISIETNSELSLNIFSIEKESYKINWTLLFPNFGNL